MKKKSLVYGTLLAIGIFIVYLGVKIYTEKTVQRNIDHEIQKMNQFADVRYGDVKVDLFPSGIRIKDVVVIPRLWKEEIRIDEGIFYGSKNEDGKPSHIHFRLEGIHLDLTRPNDVLETYFDSLGLRNTKADLECELSYDENLRILNLKEIRLGAGGIGTAEMSLRLNNFDADTIGSLPQNILMLLITLSGISIEHAEIKYQNETLMDKLIAVFARQQSQQADDYYQSLVLRLEEAYQNETDPGVKQVIKGIQDFFKKKDKISIRLAPESPVPLGKLYWIKHPKRLIDLLGIKVSA